MGEPPGGLAAYRRQRPAGPDHEPGGSAAGESLGPENAFLVAVGPLAGTGAPQLGRISVGAKSPLTLGIKEANAGGPVGQFLDRLGIRAVVVQGTPLDDRIFRLIDLRGWGGPDFG